MVGSASLSFLIFATYNESCTHDDNFARLAILICENVHYDLLRLVAAELLLPMLFMRAGTKFSPSSSAG